MEQQMLFSLYDEGMQDFLLISLHNEYYQQIRSGIKKFEYRRKFYKKAAKAFVYVNAPIRQVLGIIDFGTPIIDTPEAISRLAESQRKGHGGAILSYLSGLAKGYAIPILSFMEGKPIDIATIKKKFPDFQPPQSYIILNKYPKFLSFLISASK